MKTLTGIIVCFSLGLAPCALAQNATGSSKGEQGNQNGAGMMTVAMGSAYAGTGCPPCGAKGPCNVALCVAGIGGIIEGMMTMGNSSKNTKPSRDAIQAGGVGGGSYGDTSSDPFNALNSSSDPTLARAKKLLAAHGITDAASMQNFLDNNPSPNLDNALANLPQDKKDELEKEKRDIINKFKVSSVPFESEGGGGFRGNRSSGSDLDLAGLFSGLNKDRAPASIAGLTRSLDGQPIGISADDIFKQVSRRYQSKIEAQSFLEPSK